MDQDRLEKSKFTGATVGRLLRRIVERHAPEGEIVAQLEAMTALMDEFDAADVARRRVSRGCHAQRPRGSGVDTESWVLGDTIWRPKARLSKPSRRDRRGRRSKDEGETSEAAPSSDDAAEADAVTAAESSEEAASSDDEPTDGAEAQLDGVDGTPSQPRKNRRAKTTHLKPTRIPTRGFLCRRRLLRLRGLGHLGGWSGIIPRERNVGGGLGVLDQNALSVLAELGMTDGRGVPLIRPRTTSRFGRPTSRSRSMAPSWVPTTSMPPRTEKPSWCAEG